MSHLPFPRMQNEVDGTPGLRIVHTLGPRLLPGSTRLELEQCLRSVSGYSCVLCVCIFIHIKCYI